MVVPQRPRSWTWLVSLGLALVALLAACGGAPATSSPVPARVDPSPSAAPGSASPAQSSRAADLAFLLEQLDAAHPDPWLGEDPDAFAGRIQDVAARADDLGDDQFLVEVMRLVGGRDRDGHTGLFPFAQDEVGLQAWPLALYQFEEGLYVVDALEPYEDAVGSRVVEIGGRPVAEVAEAVTPLVSRDNDWTVRARLPGYLVVPHVLRGLGLLPDGAAALTLEREDATRVELNPDPIPMAEWVAWRNLFYPLVPLTLPPDDDGPRYLQHRGEPFWSEQIGETLYVGYNLVQSRTPAGNTISELAATVRSAFEAGEVSQVVVDIRGNPGGDNFTYPPFRDVLREQAADDPGSVTVLIGRSTFSAAGNFATELRRAEGVQFVGEPTGAAPNLWGDAREVTLPFSGLVVHIATRWWEFAPDDASLAIEPDVVVPVRWADYAAGRDPALEQALDR